MATATRPATVGDLMSDAPVVIGLDTSLAEAAEVMDVYHISGLPVCDANGRLVGVLSQTDIVHAFATESLRRSSSQLTARHLMTRPAICVEPGLPLLEAARAMRRKDIHRLVVVASDSEAPVGVLAMSDIVRWVTGSEVRKGRAR